MADSPIRDGGDQPLDDEKPLRTADDTSATSPAATSSAATSSDATSSDATSSGATSSGATSSGASSPRAHGGATPAGHGETGRAPLPGEDAAGPLDGDDSPGNAGHQPPVPTGGEPGAPDPNMEYGGDADFVAEATGERYTRSVQAGLDRIDEHKARIAELEAERAAAPDVPDEPLEPGPGAPDVPGAPDEPGVPDLPGAPQVPDVPVQPDVPGAPPTPGAPGAPEAPMGPGVLRPPAGGDDVSGLDDPYDGGVPR